MLRRDDTVLVLVDVQGKLADVMHDRALLLANLEKLIACMRALDVPIICTEQAPGKMGETIPRLKALLTDLPPIPKTSFSCVGEPAFVRALEATGRRSVLLAGIEAHVCVYQTAADLTALGYHTEVVADAVSSRLPGNIRIGLAKACSAGAGSTSVEAAVFELMRTADHPRFRDILRIVK